MRQIAAKAIIFLLAIIIAVILIAPGVTLAPAVSRTDWSACLLVIFMTWLAAIFGGIDLVREHMSSLARDSLLAPNLLCVEPRTSTTLRISLRC